MKHLHLDYETRSLIDLTKVGTYIYARHPSTEITHAAWGFDKDNLTVWDRREGPEKIHELYELLKQVAAGTVTLVAHNAAFEWHITTFVLPRQFKLQPLEIPFENLNCTLSRSLIFGMPGGLDKVSTILGLGENKYKRGAALMKKHMRPRKLSELERNLWQLYKANPSLEEALVWEFRFDARFPLKDQVYRVGDKERKLTLSDRRKLWPLINTVDTRFGEPVWWAESAEEIQEIADYCKQDVVIEMAIDAFLPQLIPSEKIVWCLDQRINLRGVPIDVPRVKLLNETAAIAFERVASEITTLTNGEVTDCTEVSAILSWLKARGWHWEELTKDKLPAYIAFTRACDDELAARVLELREEGAKASVKKLSSMLRMVYEDGIIRNNLQYYGAATGRWAGRGVQMQNIARLDQRALGILDALIGPDPEAISPEELYGRAKEAGENILNLIGGTMRALLKAPYGYKFTGGDFSNIEGRVNAWLAGEEWKIQAFRDYDTIIYNEDGTPKLDEKGEPERLGPDLYKLAFAKGDPIAAKKVSKNDRQKGKAQELALGYQGGVNAFLVFAKTVGLVIPSAEAEVLVKDWRKAHPAITKGWKLLENAVYDACKRPGTSFPLFGGKLVFKKDGDHLYCRLPSGRALVYMHAGWRTVKKFGQEVTGLYYFGVDSKKFWGERQLYGGLICENVVQAIARDLMAAAMVRGERKNLNLVLTVHDELLILDKDPESEQELLKVLQFVPSWAEGLPLAAECWTDVRYVK